MVRPVVSVEVAQTSDWASRRVMTWSESEEKDAATICPCHQAARAVGLPRFPPISLLAHV